MIVALVAVAGATTVEVSPGDDLRPVFAGLAPGDEVVLQPGTHTVTARLSLSVSGTETAPIVIRGPDVGEAIVHRPNAAQNLIDIEGADWIEFRNLTFSGGSAGLRFTDADHITVADCEIRDTADVALRANDAGSAYDGWRILRNHIHHTGGFGEGMYLGCTDAACAFTHGRVVGNHVHDTGVSGESQGDGIEVKSGSWGNEIRDNVVHDTVGPCIISYDGRADGPNVIAGNALWNCGNHAIQTTAHTRVFNNIVVSAAQSGIAVQPSGGASVANVQVLHNTVVSAGSADDATAAVALRGVGTGLVVANNALYHPGENALLVLFTPEDELVGSANVVEGATDPGVGTVAGSRTLDVVNASGQNAPPVDVFPTPGGALVGAGDATWTVPDDFNGRPRTGAVDVGAYAFEAGGNPGWVLAATFKTLAGPPAPPNESADTGQPVGPGTPSTDSDALDGIGPQPMNEGCGCGGSGPRGPWIALALFALVARRRGG